MVQHSEKHILVLIKEGGVNRERFTITRGYCGGKEAYCLKREQEGETSSLKGNKGGGIRGGIS